MAGWDGEKLKISCGPVPWNWSRRELLRFYQWVAANPFISRVYVGELSCTKRQPSPKLLSEIVDILASAGKDVVFTTPPVIVSSSEFELLVPLISVVPELEANNHGTVALWQERFRDKPLTCGPYLDVYNEKSAKFYRDLGASGVVAPVDLELPMLADLSAAFPNSTEAIAFGRQGLAFSWRCYTVRREGKLGRECARQCRKRRSVRLETLEGEPVFRANGQAIYAEVPYFPESTLDTFVAAGVSCLRIEPQGDRPSEAIELADMGIEALSGHLRVQQEGLDREYLTGPEKQRRTEPLAAVPVLAKHHHLPHPLSFVVVPLLRLAVKRHPAILSALEGRSFALGFKSGRPLVLCVKDGAVAQALPGTRPDSLVRASFRTFLAIWFGRLDPDAAFFQRKAELSGSLTVSVTAKNVFDGFLR